jgi:glycosyltransferase 2 family protein
MQSADSQNNEPTPPPRRRKGRSRLTNIAGLVITIAIFIWIGRGIATNWPQLSIYLARISAGAVATAACMFFLFTLFISQCYYQCLRLAGATVKPVPAMSVYMASQLGKYLPGKVIYVAAQIGLATWLRIPVTQSVLGFTASQIIIAASGALIASPLLGIAVGRGTGILVIVMTTAGFLVLASGIWVKPFNFVQRKRKKPGLETFSPARAVLALLSAGASWTAYAALAAVLAAAMMNDLGTRELVQIGTAAVAAWLIGYVSFITPAGMGVREGALVVLTHGVLPEPNAMALALMMRLLHTALQLAVGGLALAYAMRQRNTAAGTTAPAP